MRNNGDCTVRTGWYSLLRVQRNYGDYEVVQTLHGGPANFPPGDTIISGDTAFYDFPSDTTAVVVWIQFDTAGPSCGYREGKASAIAPCRPRITPTPTNTPGAANLVGHVTWQGRPAQPNTLQQLPITLTLKVGATEVNYPATTTDASGFFTVSVGGLPGGTYNWRVKNPKYLANSGTVTLTGAPTTGVEMGLMKAGDCNNDNLVTVSDFNILKPTFGKGNGDPGYDGRADFTGDQIVNLSDFNLLKVNFGSPGAPPLGPQEGDK